MGVRRHENRGTESVTPSKGGRGRESRTNALTVTTSSIKESHYTLINSPLLSHALTHAHTDAHPLS